MSSRREIADVCIIGAGLAGGILAYELGRKGVKVIVLEAGPRHNPEDKYEYMKKHLRGERPWAPDIPERDVYTNAGELAYPLHRFRVKGVGGTTLHWSAVSLRLQEADFRMKSLYGLAEDWPLSYEELEPYYGKAEDALGVAGIADNPFASYRSSDYPLPPFPYSYANQIIKQGCDKLGIQMHHVPYARNSIPSRGRPNCHAFGTCIPVCPIEAQYNAEMHIRLAEKTGNVTIFPRANAVRMNAALTGLIESVTYAGLDKSEQEQRARLFVVAAHAVESARLLLLSRSQQFPYGLANNSGLVGKYFMEHPYAVVSGKLKQNLFPYRIGFHTAETHQFVAPKRRDIVGAFKLDFEGGGPRPHEIALESGHWGADLRAEIRETFGCYAQIGILLEQLPSEKNTVTLDANVSDYFGNPVPCLTYSLGEYDNSALKGARKKAEEILDALAATQMVTDRENVGFCGHHIGTCRMGDNRETSVVNRDLRAHDVRNLFIVGSSVFVTGAAVNPSLTIAALAIRAADHILKDGA